MHWVSAFFELVGVAVLSCHQYFSSKEKSLLSKFQYIEQIKHSRLRPGGGYHFAVSMLRKISHEIYKSILKVTKSPKLRRSDEENYEHIPGQISGPRHLFLRNNAIFCLKMRVT